MSAQAEWQQMLADTRDPELGPIVEAALADAGLLGALLEGLVSKNEVYRYNCFRVLLRISQEQPSLLYGEWYRFAGLLQSDNSYHRSIAVQLLARLTAVDADKRFEELFDSYFALLDDESVITARYVAQSAGQIARSKPYLQARITEQLLGIEGTRHPEGRKELIKADAIESFGEFFHESPDKERIVAFVEGQQQSSSPKTRKAAKAFLKRFGR